MRLALALLALLPLSALAGCLDAGAGDLEAAAAALDDAPAAPQARLVPLSHEGVLPTGACAATPVTPCMGRLVRATESAWEHPLDGVLDGAELTLTWDAQTPASERLIVGLAIKRDGEWSWEHESGVSPLTLSRGGLAIPSDAEVWVYANGYRCMGANVAYACATAEQPFRLEGTLSVVG